MKIMISAFFIIFLSVQKLYIPQFVPLVTVDFAYRYEYAQRFCRSKYLCILQTSLDIQLLPTPCIYFLQAFLKYLGIACIECFAQILFRSSLYLKVVGSISLNLIDLRLFQTNCLEIVYRLSTDIYSAPKSSLYPKLYTPSTLNITLILWHTQLIVCAIKCYFKKCLLKITNKASQLFTLEPTL